MPRKSPHAGQRHIEEAVEELVHPLAPQGHLHADVPCPRGA